MNRLDDAQFCSSDPARHTDPALCEASFIELVNDAFDVCKYNHELGKCRRSGSTLHCPPMPPMPPPAPPALPPPFCTQLGSLERLDDVGACRTRSSAVCEKAFYKVGGSGRVAPCVYREADGSCEPAPDENQFLCPPMAPRPPPPARPPFPPAPPAPPPPPKYPKAEWLSHEKCHDLLRDSSHRFRRMWAAEAWAPMQPGQPACWETVRNRPKRSQMSSTFFDETLQGRHCDSNWYQGNGGTLGTVGPDFSKTHAPALLGFDESIDEYCGQHLEGNQAHIRGHATRCVAANLNILSLYGDRLPYNICRNLEWMTCAAQGKLRGQGGKTIKFAKAPHTLDLARNNRLGVCSGWVPDSRPKGGIYGYSTDDIFYLETCMYSQMCSNGRDLFTLAEGQSFTCAFEPALFRELQEILLTPADPPGPHEQQCRQAHLYQEQIYEWPPDADLVNRSVSYWDPARPAQAQQGNPNGRCLAWCTKWNCWQAECLGCGEDRGCCGDANGRRVRCEEMG